MTNGTTLILILNIFYFWMAMSLVLHPVIYLYISQLIRFAGASSQVSDFNNRKFDW